jgi:hypothetical protein
MVIKLPTRGFLVFRIDVEMAKGQWRRRKLDIPLDFGVGELRQPGNSCVLESQALQYRLEVCNHCRDPFHCRLCSDSRHSDCFALASRALSLPVVLLERPFGNTLIIRNVAALMASAAASTRLCHRCSSAVAIVLSQQCSLMAAIMAGIGPGGVDTHALARRSPHRREVPQCSRQATRALALLLRNRLIGRQILDAERHQPQKKAQTILVRAPFHRHRLRHAPPVESAQKS